MRRNASDDVTAEFRQVSNSIAALPEATAAVATAALGPTHCQPKHDSNDILLPFIAKHRPILILCLLHYDQRLCDDFIFMTVSTNILQEAQLSQRDCATHYVSRNLVKCCTAVRKITFERLAVGNDLECDSRSSELPLFDRPYITPKTTLVEIWHQETIQSLCYHGRYLRDPMLSRFFVERRLLTERQTDGRTDTRWQLIVRYMAPCGKNATFTMRVQLHF